MTEAQTRLAEVRASIKQILESGQRIRKADREVQRAELAQLRELEQQYVADVDRETVKTAGRGRNRISYLSI
jgi:hypothetical protein